MDSIKKPILNPTYMKLYSHNHNGFDHVLHIAHHEWHGIRHATAYAPGNKLLISAYDPLDENDYEYIEAAIDSNNIKKIIFQAYSDNADNLAVRLRTKFGPSVGIYAITHVNSSQFEHHFELVMQARLLMRLRYKVLNRIGSVKVDFDSVIEEYWPKTIINYAPVIKTYYNSDESYRGIIFTPLDVDWRKNLYTNIFAALRTPSVNIIYTVNFPSGIESITNYEKVRLIGYLRGSKLFSTMTDSDIVLCVTLSECQPMTQLESFSCGTMCVTRTLGLNDFTNHEIMEYCETDAIDNPKIISSQLSKVIELKRRDPVLLREMISDYLAKRHALAYERYADFIDL